VPLANHSLLLSTLALMIAPFVAVASRAALYPIQSISIVALIVSGAYFHLLDIARNAPDSAIVGDTAYPSLSTFALVESTIWARKDNDAWKWTIDPRPDQPKDV